MAKFRLVKKIDLSYLGDEWKDCYLSFYAPSFSDVKKMSELAEIKDNKKIVEEGIRVLEESFIEGKAVSDKKEIVNVNKEEIKDLPIEIIIKSITDLSGQPNPKV